MHVDAAGVVCHISSHGLAFVSDSSQGNSISWLTAAVYSPNATCRRDSVLDILMNMT